jgi:hypothetical protein
MPVKSGRPRGFSRSRTVWRLVAWWRLPKRQVDRLRLTIRDPKSRADGVADLTGADLRGTMVSQEQLDEACVIDVNPDSGLTRCMLDLTDEEKAALLNLLLEVIVADPAPLSPRVQMLRAILAKLRSPGTELQLAARPPTPEERDPR